MSSIVESSKNAIIKSLGESEHDNIFFDMGVGCGYYVFGRKKNGIITTQMIEFGDDDTIREFSKDCRHIRETNIIKPPIAKDTTIDSENYTKNLEERIAKLEDIILKMGIAPSGNE